MRLQPMIAPVMHRMNAYVHYFFVPNRLIWNDWEKFITGGRLGQDTPVFPVIQGQSDDAINTGLMGVGSLADFFDIPVQMIGSGSHPMMPISQMRFRAYQRIYNEYYRDQNLEEEIVIPSDSSLSYDEPLVAELLKLRKRAWEKDYFTSALPFAQRGDEVLLPLQGDAPVTGFPKFKNFSNQSALTSQPMYWSTADNVTASRDGVQGREELKVVDGLTADLTEASATTISELRRAFALQRWLEKMARGGSRYVEQMLYMFGVRSSDARLVS